MFALLCQNIAKLYEVDDTVVARIQFKVSYFSPFVFKEINQAIHE